MKYALFRIRTVFKQVVYSINSDRQWLLANIMVTLFRMEAYSLFEHLHLEMTSWAGFGGDRDEHITILEGIGYKAGGLFMEAEINSTV